MVVLTLKLFVSLCLIFDKIIWRICQLLHICSTFLPYRCTSYCPLRWATRMKSFKYINLACFNIVRYHINFVCSYLGIILPIWLLEWQWRPNTIWTLLQKEKQIKLFTIGFWIWMTIIVGKKWNIEHIELLQMHAYIKVLDVK